MIYAHFFCHKNNLWTLFCRKNNLLTLFFCHENILRTLFLSQKRFTHTFFSWKRFPYTVQKVFAHWNLPSWKFTIFGPLMSPLSEHVLVNKQTFPPSIYPSTSHPDTDKMCLCCLRIYKKLFYFQKLVNHMVAQEFKLENLSEVWKDLKEFAQLIFLIFLRLTHSDWQNGKVTGPCQEVLPLGGQLLGSFTYGRFPPFCLFRTS